MTTTYKYSLDSSSRKFRCPSCHKNSFVKYIEVETQRYLEDNIGRCDRESKCSHHCSPKGNKPLVNISAIPIIKPKPSFHNIDVLSIYGNNHMNNNFVKFLNTKFDPVDFKKAIKRYFIGTSNHWNGATIFWQIDECMRVRAGKVMLYDSKTGKRVKKPYPHINWMHNVLQKCKNDNNRSHVIQRNTGIKALCNADVIQVNGNVRQNVMPFILQQCLFGLHNLNDETYKTIAIVESEKTAIMMSIYLPCYIWMATGSKSGFKEKILKPLKGRNIIAYPDKSCYNDWEKEIINLKQKGFTIACSKFSEVNCISDGDDLIDFMGI